MTQLSQHFTLEEMLRSDTAQQHGIANNPDNAAVIELVYLALTLEGIRTACGNNPVLISSGYRNAQVNQLVGGASNSAHLYGCAADFTIPAFGSPLDICHALQPHLYELGIDQLIWETTWVHVGRAIPPSLEPRGQCLTIDAHGTRTGFG